MPRLRVSAISYLNTAPLMWNFEHGLARLELLKKFAVEYTIPSRCAQMLAEGSADIGIIPVAAFTHIPKLRILSDVAIAGKSAVRSILLVSSKPLDQIRSVALDTSSRSSAALIQILFAKYWQQEVVFSTAEPQLRTMLEKHDGALLIGDPALQVERSSYLTWDLGEEWRAFTGKPFVFAFWAIRGDSVSRSQHAEVAGLFSSSRDEGLLHLEQIADEWVSRVGLSREEIIRYLAECIHYQLDAENLEGLRLFFRYATELNILPHAPEPDIVGESETHNSTPAARF